MSQQRRWTLFRPEDPHAWYLHAHVNSDVRVIGDDLPGRTEVMPVSNHQQELEAEREKTRRLRQERSDALLALSDCKIELDLSESDRASTRSEVERLRSERDRLLLGVAEEIDHAALSQPTTRSEVEGLRAALKSADDLVEWLITRTEADLHLDEFAKRWGRLGVKLALDGRCKTCGQLPEIVGFDEHHHTHLIRCGCNAALSQPTDHGEVHDLEGNDVSGCEFCEAIQERDWESIELGGLTCTCARHLLDQQGQEACELCEGERHVTKHFGFDSPRHPEIVRCPHCNAEPTDQQGRGEGERP